MTDIEAVEIIRKAVVQPDGSMVAQVLPNAWVKLQFTTAACASPNCRGENHDESQHSIYSNHHFVIHDVVAIEAKQDYGDGRIRCRAHTREGDVCEGMAEAVLRRLSEPALGQFPSKSESMVVSQPEPGKPPNKNWLDRLLGG